MDLSLAIAQGFHNAPRLYGDSTVRTAPHISGIQSGLRAAGLEFALGIYDGFTGLFLQPYNGAREGGPAGFIQGVGKGIGGFVLKDLAAIVGPFGYTMKGVHKEIIKGRQPTAFIRRARIVKGIQDLQALDQATRTSQTDKVNAAWRIICEIKEEEETHKQEGFKGKLAVLRQQRNISKQGAFEDIAGAERVLQNKQEQRRARESTVLTQSGGEERRSGRLSGKKISLLKPATKGDDAGEGRLRVNSEIRRSGSDTQRQTVNGAGQRVEDDPQHTQKGLSYLDGVVDEGGGSGDTIDDRAASLAA